MDNGHFNWCNPRELVIFPSRVCDDPKCGCDRSFIGIKSRRGTTRAFVDEVPMSPAAFIAQVSEFVLLGGREVAERTIKEIAGFSEGTILTIKADDNKVVLTPVGSNHGQDRGLDGAPPRDVRRRADGLG
jgi:hypothetical protein